MTTRVNTAAALLEEHKPLFVELAAKFTVEEVLALAKSLPFDQAAADAICPRAVYSSWGAAAWFKQLDEWVQQGKSGPRSRLFVYTAAAAQFATSKQLESLVELAKQKLAILQHIKSQIDMARAKKAPLLEAALKRSSEE